MIFAFAAVPAHRYDSHFRPPQTRRTIQRHIEAAQPEAAAAATLESAFLADPTLRIPVQIETALAPLPRYDIASEVSQVRLIKRLRLGPNRSGNSDPLS
jgi:hypothetical protein